MLRFSPLTSRVRGFTLLELAVVVSIVGIIAWALLDRFLYYQEMVEKANMEYAISRFKSGLRLKKAAMLVAGRAQEYTTLATQNPIEWLDENEKPHDYAEIPVGTDSNIIPGNWYFDARSSTLTYFVKSGRYFQPDTTGQKRVRLHLVFLNNFSRSVDRSIQPTDSVTLALVEPYKWF